MKDRIEIRMLGRFFIRRPDGEVVDDDAWQTGKTTDLVRLLALNSNRRVSVTSLLEKLWPSVEETKARASLRTAASHIRRVIGTECIDRHLGGLVLRNSWVDVVAFQSLVLEARSAMHARDYQRVVTLAREAEALYVADFRAHDDKSRWAIEVCDSLKMSRQLLLADASASAVKLMWMRDAIDLATLAITVDPCFERAFRSLMRAHAGLGEIELALRAFEHCRVNLSQELGADPSPQTAALHLQILLGGIEEISLRPFTGRESQVTSLAALIKESINHDGCDVICLTGPKGSGRGALLQASSAAAPHSHLRQLLDDGRGSSNTMKLTSNISRCRSDIDVWGAADGDADWESDRMLSLIADLDPTTSRVIAIITSVEAGDLLAAKLSGGSVSVHRQATGPLDDSDLASLAFSALSGTATPGLLGELKEQSGALAGRALSILREWVASGWIIATQSGMDLYNDAAAMNDMHPVGDYFRTLLEQLSPQDMEFCHFLALLDRPISASVILKVQNSMDGNDTASLEDVQSRLEEIADLGVLHIDRGGYAFRNLAIRDAFESWLRPAVKARILRAIPAPAQEISEPGVIPAV